MLVLPGMASCLQRLTGRRANIPQSDCAWIQQLRDPCI